MVTFDLMCYSGIDYSWRKLFDCMLALGVQGAGFLEGLASIQECDNYC